MKSFNFVMQQLGDIICNVRRCSPDFQKDTRIEFLDDQLYMCTGHIYISNAETVKNFLKNGKVEPAATLFICNADCSGKTAQIPELANITVVEVTCGAAHLYNKLSKALVRAFDSSMQPLSKDGMQKQEKLVDLWQHIRNGELGTAHEIRNALQEIILNVKKFYRLFVFDSDASNGSQIQPRVIEQVNMLFQNCAVFPYKSGDVDEIIAIQFFDEQPFYVLDGKNDLQDMLIENNMHVMISNCTRDYGRIYTLYRLARRSNYLAERLRLEPETRVYFYERYSMYSVLDMCAQRYVEVFGHTDILYLVHPIAVYLTRYDEQTNNNLRDVLYFYLFNNCDLKRSANMLYMHRNTVSNKLNQIRNMCPVNFDDGALNQRLLFSCQLLRYYERVMDQQVNEKRAANNSKTPDESTKKNKKDSVD